MATLLAGCIAGCSSDDNNADTAPVVTPQPLALTILHINDHHSHLDAETASLQLATAADKREAINVERGGFPRVTQAIADLAKNSTNVLKLHAGDALTGDLYFNLSEGKSDADLMNTVCFDAFTLGNHEFDNADAGLKKFIDFLHDKRVSPNCATPVLSANVKFGANSALSAAKAPNYVRPSVVLERGGQKIGVIGMTIAGKTKNASRPDADTTFADEIVTAQAEIDRLKAQGINKIVISGHLGYDFDKNMATKLSGVDVIIGADSHTLLGPAAMSTYGLTPAGAYPTKAQDKDGNPVCIAQAWEYATVVGELKISFDDKGVVTQCEGTPHMLIGDNFMRGTTAVSAAEKTAILADIAAGKVLRVTAPAPAATAILAPYKKAKEDFGATVVAQSTDNLCLRRVPGPTRDRTRSSLGDLCNLNAHVIAHGGDIQQVVAEAFLQQGKAFFGADISVQNGGGVRVDVKQGPVSVKDVYTVLPFKNTLVQLNATGAELKAVLEDAVAAVVANNTGSYPYTGGLRFNVDMNQAKGARVTGLQVRNAAGGWDVLDMAKVYKVATINFLADGADFYTSFAAIKGKDATGADRRLDVGLDYAEAFLKYVQNLPGTPKTLVKLPTASYSTQTYIETSAN
jgi:5'-nucleotidase